MTAPAAKRPVSHLAPDLEEFAFELRDGYANVPVPEMRGYAMVVFED